MYDAGRHSTIPGVTSYEHRLVRRKTVKKKSDEYSVSQRNHPECGKTRPQEMESYDEIDGRWDRRLDGSTAATRIPPTST